MLEHVLQSKFGPAVTLIDEEDAELLAAFPWRIIHTTPRKAYVMAAFGGSTLYLHRMIMGVKDKRFVDHINGNGLDNRRKNLRLCTREQNGHNSIGWSKRRTGLTVDPVYKGVWRSSRGHTFESKICWQGKQRYIGTFRTAEEAARAYDEYARTFHGRFARLNFPQAGEMGVHDPERR